MDEVTKGKSGNCYSAYTVMIRSLQTLSAISFPGCVVLNTKNMIKECLECSRNNFDALKCCVCVAKNTAVTTHGAKSLNSAATD